MKITTYRSKEDRWLAHVDFGNDTYMPFFGATEEAAVARAEAWYAKERARWARFDVGASEVAGETENRTSINPSGNGQVFLGKVWMLNRATGERARVDAGEVVSYEGRGFVRGGPRSK